MCVWFCEANQLVGDNLKMKIIKPLSKKYNYENNCRINILFYI